MANVPGIKAPPKPTDLPKLPAVGKPAKAKADMTSTGRNRTTQHVDGKIGGYGKGC